MKREILAYPDPRLSIVSTPVDIVDEQIQELVEDMIETMIEANGIGLAAPQIGVHKEVIVIARSIIEAIENESDEDAENTEEEDIDLECLVIINPKLILSGDDIMYQEGCLSVPEYREDVPRKSKVKLEALDSEGKHFTLDAEGLLAICLQHETDHLAGKLFIDRLSFLKRSLYDKKILKRGV